MTNILKGTCLQTQMNAYSEPHNLQFVSGKAFAYWSCDTVTFNSTMHVKLTFKEQFICLLAVTGTLRQCVDWMLQWNKLTFITLAVSCAVRRFIKHRRNKFVWNCYGRSFEKFCNIPSRKLHICVSVLMCFWVARKLVAVFTPQSVCTEFIWFAAENNVPVKQILFRWYW